ncbi:MAG: phosphate acyltransferase PlsX [Phycisphaerales bacterium JB058]
MRIAVDVMGGDNAPDDILRGCIEGLQHLAPDDKLVLFGNQRDIDEVLEEAGVSDARLEVVATTQVIEMAEAPSLAVKGKPDSSIVQMCRYSSQREQDPAKRCDAALSAGNTGACVAAGIMQMKRLPGIHRPGISVAMPSMHGPMVLCDAGANPEPTATHLWQYAVMADVVARKLLHIDNPRVAVMNIGAEDSKGTGTIKQARDMIKATPGLNYIGFIEGREFFAGVADVVVTDGLMGNVVLKTAEGIAKSIFEAITQEILEIDSDLMSRFAPVAKSIWKKNDYHEYGGAPLIGVNGTLFIAHGSSEPRTIANAIRSCREYVSTGINDGIVERIAEAEAAVLPQTASA